MQNLRATIEMLSKYRGLPSNGWLEEVISNLELRFGVKSDAENLVSFGQNEQLKVLNIFLILLMRQSAINHWILNIFRLMAIIINIHYIRIL